MSHAQIGRREEVDSRLLVVGSQTASLTPGPSFAHNLGCRCPNRQCEGIFDIYVSRPFPMTPRTLQCEVFFPLLSSSEHSGVPEDSQPPTFPSVGLHPHTWPKWGCDIFFNLSSLLSPPLDPELPPLILAIAIRNFLSAQSFLRQFSSNAENEFKFTRRPTLV
jgi:hypothetical protein